MVLFSKIKHYFIAKKQQRNAVQYMSQIVENTIDSAYKISFPKKYL